MTEQKSTKNMN